jgi:hypothetical protein
MHTLAASGTLGFSTLLAVLAVVLAAAAMFITLFARAQRRREALA